MRLKQDLGEARRQIQSLQVRVEECNKQRKSRNMILVREPWLYDSASSVRAHARRRSVTVRRNVNRNSCDCAKQNVISASS